MSDTTRPMALDSGMDPRLDVFNRLLKNRVVNSDPVMSRIFRIIPC